MSDETSLDILRVGVPIPTVQANSGGAYEFQQTVFAEVLNRINLSQPLHEPSIRYVPISTFPVAEDAWNIDPEIIVSIYPDRFLELCSTLHGSLRRLRHPWSPLAWEQSLTARAALRKLTRKVHVIWSLETEIFSDQLPFILTVWDLQHRLQPFFPEVSRAGVWESRHLHYSTTGRKAFLSVVGTKRGSDELHQFYGVDPSRVLINPLPCPTPLTPLEKEIIRLLQRFSLSPTRYLLYPAQFWSHKNHLAVLLALRQLVDQGHSFKLVLTGTDKGALFSLQTTINQLGLGDFVVLTGFVDRQDLAVLYINSFALVYASFFGPDNIPPLEAMSYRVPAIVADVPGAVEQYGDSVLRFDPRKPEQIVRCVNRLLNEPNLRCRLVRNGLRLISSLTPAAYVDRVEAFLSSESLPLLCSSLVF